jgi:2-polyprenyl-3-methyl-5-hydroxy-6-metoxy-1,4-benzoquinol methylase
MDWESKQQIDSFYEALAPVADKIFPLSVRKTSFFEELFGRSDAGSLLDLACGSGEFACHFALGGMEVVGLDVVPAMIRAARKRSMEMGAGAMFIEADMVTLDETELEKFDAITCLGNSVTYVQDIDGVISFFETCMRHLTPAGLLSVQTVNMDSFLALGRMDFPRLSATLPNGLEALLTRTYKLLPSGEHLVFGTELALGSESHRFEARLLCIRKNQLVDAFCEAGFNPVECYGDFLKSKWTDASPATIVVGFAPE